MNVQLVNSGLRPIDLGFDFPDWRAGQLEIAERILNSQKPVITLSAPTGFGKSAVVQIPARISLERQLILTRTKQLQTQYERDGIIALYGRDNYACNLQNRLTAAQGVCRLGVPCSFFNSGCNYYDQKRDAIAASEATLNYSYFFLEANGPGQFSQYDWIVCDEGHAVPEELSRTFSIRIYFPACRSYGIRVPKDKSLPSLITWARDNLQRLRFTIYRHKEASNNNNLAMRGIEFLHKMEQLSFILKAEDWICDLADQAATIRPIWPEFLAISNLWPHARKFVFSSATMNPAYTLPLLGIDPHNAENIEAPSSFFSGFRPIFIRPKVTMNHANDADTLMKWINEIDKIIAEYPQEKGLIHTGNYRLAKLLLDNSIHVSRLVGHTSETRQLTLERFKAMTDNKVLVSPALTEGVDLPYDLCRFQIIGKVPFPNMVDKVWEARKESDPLRFGRVYTQTAIDSVVQAAGRGMRAEDDYCETWIIDSNIERLLKHNNRDFPRFFKEAIA